MTSFNLEMTLLGNCERIPVAIGEFRAQKCRFLVLFARFRAKIRSKVKFFKCKCGEIEAPFKWINLMYGSVAASNEKSNMTE